MIVKSDIAQRAFDTGFIATPTSSITPTIRGIVWNAMLAEQALETPAESAWLDYQLRMQLEALQLHNLCERAQLEALGGNPDAVPVAQPTAA